MSKVKYTCYIPVRIAAQLEELYDNGYYGINDYIVDAIEEKLERDERLNDD